MIIEDAKACEYLQPQVVRSERLQRTVCQLCQFVVHQVPVRGGQG